MANFMALDSRSVFSQWYAYIDIKEYAAGQIFKDKNVHVKYKNDYVKDGIAYCIVLCVVPKKQRELFEACMKELSNKIVLLGHPDYPMFCEGYFKMLDDRAKQLEEGM